MGVDPIAGLNASYILSEGLKDYLSDYGISYLAQAQKQIGNSLGLNGWYTACDLDLGGEWVDQWTTFIKGLTHGGIKIRNTEDSLLWMYDKKSSLVTPRKAYELIVSESLPLTNQGILTQVWHYTISQKIKCFI